MLETPIRFTMTADEAAAGCAVAGIPQSAVLSGADRFMPTPERVLSDAEMVGPDGTLLAPAAIVLDVIAHPVAVSTAVVHMVGSSEWRRVSMPSNAHGWVARAASGEDLDVMFAPTVSAATVMLDDLFDLTTFSSQDGTLEVELSAHGWWALLAVSDARKAHLLAAELDRSPPGSFAVDEAGITAVLQAGSNNADTRWLVTALKAQSPVAMGGIDISTGMDELARTGLVNSSEAGWSVTEDGTSILDALAQVISIGSLTHAVSVDDEMARVGEVTLFVGALRLLIVVWGGLGSDTPNLTLAEVNSETALTLIRDLIGFGTVTAAT